MLNNTISITLLLVSALPCFAQGSTPSEPRLGALMAFEREIEAASARGDIAFLTRALADDLEFTHGDTWRTGRKPSLVDTKKSWIEWVGSRPFASREVSSQQVEPHGSIAITTGRIDVKLKAESSGRRKYSIWFVRVYRAKDGGWELLSHRTVAEPTS